MRIRRAMAGDAGAVSGLLAELGYPTPPDVLPNRLRKLEDEGSVALLAIDDHGTPVGLACLASHATLHNPAPVAYIMALVTTSASRGKGVGRALVVAAEEWARNRGCSRLSVTSAEQRADAHVFYPSCGMPYSGRRFTKSLD